jgi:hypothetical protein
MKPHYTNTDNPIDLPKTDKKMNPRIREIANECYFDVNQIVADVLCPDYNGPEMHKVADAFNALPKEIRAGIIETLTKNQTRFVQSIIRECIEVIDLTSDNTKLMREYPYQKIIWAIEEHFGMPE